MALSAGQPIKITIEFKQCRHVETAHKRCSVHGYTVGTVSYQLRACFPLLTLYDCHVVNIARIAHVSSTATKFLGDVTSMRSVQVVCPSSPGLRFELLLDRLYNARAQ
jgi:hypothetical protein